MNDDFIKHETWYFIETKSDEVRAMYNRASEESMQFILDRYSELHIMHLVAPVSKLQLYFEDLYTSKLANTEVAKRLHKQRLINEDEDSIMVLSNGGKW